MRIGTHYYPEQWPRGQWERDFDSIAAMGLQIVHMGQTAWFDLEPRAGEFRFDWLGECVEMAAERKLAVVLCTPTAAPPVWLSEQHPEVLPLDDSGRRLRSGTRRRYSPTAPAMQEAAARIVGALAERFGGHPAVVGWQIDSECGWPYTDQNEHAHAAFRKWLVERYGAIEAVNRAWGCQIWSTQYTRFEQIVLPAGREAPDGNPHLLLDASRFWSWAFAEFGRLQSRILRPKIGSRFITTDFMMPQACIDANPADMAGDVDLSTWISYPVGGEERRATDETFRIGDPAAVEFQHDLMASYQGRLGVMELQPGQVRWPTANLLYPGVVRLWLWTAIAHGAELAASYRYRQPLVGHDVFRHGLVGTDGVTATMEGRELAQTIDEVQRLDLAKLPPLEKEYDPRRTVGIVFDWEQLWWYRIQPQTGRWDALRFVFQWHAAVSQLGLRVRVLRPGQAWPEHLRMMIVPGLEMVDDELIARLDRYAAGGGHLLLTCRTGLRDRRGHVWQGPWASPLLPLIGGTIDAYDGLPEQTFGRVELIDDQEYEWGVWGDLLYAEPDTKVLAKYADQFYAGGIAAMQRRHGKGVVSYCGVAAEQPFVNALVHRLAAQAKLPAGVLPPRVRVVRRGPYRILLNYQDTAVEAPVNESTEFLVGSHTVEPAGVAVWEE